jgi:ubiquinone/menaquinone biosynthesis C-methylase UbiE
MAELVFERQAAAEYDRAFAHVARYFMPSVLRAARIATGMRVLDIATGIGLSAEAALSAVGPTGHVTAGDVSPAMTEIARERLGEALNASVFGRGRAGSLFLRRNFRRGSLQSRADVFP